MLAKKLHALKCDLKKWNKEVLDSLDNEALEGFFLEEEVTKALSDLGGDKVPRLNGFSLAF